MDEILDLNSSNWEKEVVWGDRPALVDFWAPDCDLSKSLLPKLENLARKYAGRIKVCKVNVQDNAALAGQYEVSKTPRVIIFNRGSKPVHQLVGVISESDLAKLLNHVLGVTE